EGELGEIRIVHIPWALTEAIDKFIANSTIEGLNGEFFNNRNLEGEPVLKRSDTKIDFNFGESQPEGVPKENFSARWIGKFNVADAGKYLFAVKSDDGSRVFVDGEKVIDFWWNHQSKTKTALLDMKAGMHDLRVEY